MAGLEVITNAILSEAEKKASEKMAEANNRIEEINNEYKAEIERIAESGKTARDDAVKTVWERFDAEKAAYEREMLLKTERETAKELIEEAKNRILDMPEAEYFAYLAEIYKNQGSIEGGEILLCAEDRADMPENFVENLGSGLTLASDAAPSKGFIIRQGRVYINCTIDAIFRELESELYDIAAGKE